MTAELDNVQIEVGGDWINLINFKWRLKTNPPREWWVVDGLAYTLKEDAENHAKRYNHEMIHVQAIL